MPTSISLGAGGGFGIMRQKYSLCFGKKKPASLFITRFHLYTPWWGRGLFFSYRSSSLFCRIFLQSLLSHCQVLIWSSIAHALFFFKLLHDYVMDLIVSKDTKNSNFMLKSLIQWAGHLLLLTVNPNRLSDPMPTLSILKTEKNIV